MNKKSVLLPNFCISDIYSRNPLVHAVVMPIGVAYDKIRAMSGGPDNEKDNDKYECFHLTAVELVDNRLLTARQLRRVEKDRQLSGERLFLGTIVKLEEDGNLWERQVFMSAYTLVRIGVAEPRLGRPTGDKKKVILNKEIDWTIKGQYWAWSRPRVQSIDIKPAAKETVEKINTMLADPKTQIIRSPVPIFWTPKESAVAVLVFAGAACRILAQKALG